MSNDDNTSQPPLSSSDPTPEQGIGALAEPPPGTPVPPPVDVPPSIDATQVLPVVPTLPAAAVSAPQVDPVIPPPPSGAIPTSPTHELPPESWYRKPGVVAGVLLGLLVVAAIVIFLVLAGDDDADGIIDDVAPEAVSVVVTRVGSGGQPLNTSLSATVAVLEPDVDAYTWVIPSDGVVGQAGLRQTDATGRVEFRWAPSDLADTATWTSTVEVAEFVAGEGDQVVTDLAVECSIDRDGSSEALAVDSTVQSDANDPTVTVANYSFPNFRLIAGDRVDCTSTNVIADAAPVISESTTTVPESTTTVPESTTTVPETTTTVPETTTTVAETTTTSSTTTTAQPAPADPVIGEFLRGRSDLTEAAALLDRVGLLAELEASGEPFTIFVPTNEAIQAAKDGANPPDFNDDAVVRALFEAHIVRGEALDGATIADRTSIEVSNGGPQPVDASVTPVRVGGVPVTQVDNAVDGGVVHVLSGVMPIQP